MADYYTEFSVILDRPEGVSPEKIVEFEREIDKFVEKEQETNNAGSIQYALEKGIGSNEPGGGGIWIYSDGQGDADLAAAVIQRFLRHFDLDYGVYMSWARYCSKPRSNAAMGGAVVVTRDSMMWANSMDLIPEAREAGIEVVE